ncbi:Subunit of heteropentameric Replication factor C (RF-C) [Nowakowskiella sp. JEL0078]|nr:Subunit of heteropentameric Replication factor C (RF-C) [Nowakowskiella sp. JEL0078]
MLYVDKHRPTSLGNLDFHHNLNARLSSLSNANDFPHLLIYGPSGAGKKTRVIAVLKEIFGQGVEKVCKLPKNLFTYKILPKLKVSIKQFQTPGGKKLDIHLVSSNYHVELTPSDVGIYDRVVIQELIKEMAQTQQVDSNSKRQFKVAIFNEADSLSKDAQAALRRTMEKYMKNMRMILICNSTSKIISPIRSRCLLLRVSAPSNEEITSVLKKVAIFESFKLPDSFSLQIAKASEGNLRKALLMLEAAKTQQYPFTENQKVQSSDWEIFIKGIAKEMIQEQSPAKLLAVRGKLYELISHCIPPDLILKTLALELINNVDTGIRTDIINYAAEFEHRLRLGNKAIFHLEAFVARFMSIYKQFLVEIGAD